MLLNGYLCGIINELIPMRRFLQLLILLSSAGAAMAQIPEYAINLSAEGTANCYIVAPGSTAYFDATHKGNSLTETTGDIAGTKLVWQSAQSLVTRRSSF